MRRPGPLPSPPQAPPAARGTDGSFPHTHTHTRARTRAPGSTPSRLYAARGRRLIPSSAAAAARPAPSAAGSRGRCSPRPLPPQRSGRAAVRAASGSEPEAAPGKWRGRWEDGAIDDPGARTGFSVGGGGGLAVAEGGWRRKAGSGTALDLGSG